MEIQKSAREILQFQVERGITNTFKEALIILEDLELEHHAALKRLESELPEEYRKLVRTANYWYGEKRDSLRKRILLVGNDAKRAIEKQMEKMEVKFK